MARDDLFTQIHAAQKVLERLTADGEQVSHAEIVEAGEQLQKAYVNVVHVQDYLADTEYQIARSYVDGLEFYEAAEEIGENLRVMQELDYLRWPVSPSWIKDDSPDEFDRIAVMACYRRDISEERLEEIKEQNEVLREELGEEPG